MDLENERRSSPRLQQRNRDPQSRIENIVIIVRARTRLLDPPDVVTLAVIVNGREVGTITPETRAASDTTIPLPAASSVLVNGFNRIALERRSGTAPVGVYEVAVR